MKPAARLLITVLVLLTMGLPALATTFVERTLDELIEAAELAFHATVSSVTAVLQDGEPWTEVTFELHELLLDPEADPVDSSSVTLRFLGGSAGGSQLSVALMPEFEPGDEVLLLAYTDPYYSPVVGFNQGLWYLDPAGSWLDVRGQRLGLSDEGSLLPDTETATAAAAVTEELRSRLELR